VPIQISEALDKPVPTTTVNYAANLPSTATTASSYPSSTVQVYDGLGTPGDITMNWTNTGTDTWQLQMTTTASIDDAGDASTDDLDQTFDFTFNNGTSGTIPGSLASITQGSENQGLDGGPAIIASGSSGTPASIQLPVFFSQNGGLQNITFNFGDIGAASGLTQYTGSAINVATLSQNGVATGSFSSLGIDDSGNITINYTNNQTTTVYQIPVAQFDDPDALQASSGGTFTQTLGSGTAELTQAGTNGAGAIDSSELESSNVDIVGQFTSMIQAQQVYSANSKTITTVNQMLSDLLNVIS
jgi:flagellar hook protein FlgE